jgi:hypothetical protein
MSLAPLTHKTTPLAALPLHLSLISHAQAPKKGKQEEKEKGREKKRGRGR